jgi:hypothetical protein
MQMIRSSDSEFIGVTDHQSQVLKSKQELNVIIADLWWIADADTATLLSNYLTFAFANIRKYHSEFWFLGTGPHGFFYHALWSLNIDFLMIGFIGNFIIRDSSILPPVDKLAELGIPDSDTTINIAASIAAQNRKSFLRAQLDQLQNKKHVYDTIKNFNFLAKEKL